MFRQRSMTRLAVHMRVLTLALHIQNVGMAAFACLMAGEFCGTGRDVTNCISAVVTVLPKTAGNHVSSNDKKYDEGENEQPRKAE